MARKKWWRIFMWVMAVTNVAIILLIVGSAKPEVKNTVVPETGWSAVEIPDSAFFAGEKVPLKRFDVKEALDRELIVNSYFHSQTIRLIKMAPRYFSLIEPILKENGIPDDFKYLAVAESGFNTRAVSGAGAVGFWQFLRGTARDYGLEVNDEIDERYHVEKATLAACSYMKDAYERYGSWTMVAASFNAGMRGVERQMERQKTNYYYDLLFTEETQRYVFRIIALKLVLEDPEKYNFHISEEEKYPVIKTKIVEVQGPVADFADFAHDYEINYKILKDFNPWLRENYLTNPTGKKYIIKIPILK